MDLYVREVEGGGGENRQNQSEETSSKFENRYRIIYFEVKTERSSPEIYRGLVFFLFFFLSDRTDTSLHIWYDQFSK